MRRRRKFYLDPKRIQELRAEARSQGTTLLEVLRQLVERHFEAQVPPPAPPPATHLRFVGLGSSGRRDVADRRDQYLGEAHSKKHAR